MKNAIISLAAIGILLATSGCANGPLRQWFRGSACNTCTPPAGQPANCGVNFAESCDTGTCSNRSFNSGCESGVCGTGLFGNMFGRNNNAPASIPATTFETSGSVPYYGDPNYSNSAVAPMQNQSIPSGEIYGNSGEMVTPPAIGPINDGS